MIDIMKLKVGMKRKDILKEFKEIGLHGENQELVKEFLGHANDSMVGEDAISVTNILNHDNQRYGIIRQYQPGMIRSGTPILFKRGDNVKTVDIPMPRLEDLSKRYFLTGIESDDDRYFLHPLRGVPFDFEYMAKNRRDEQTEAFFRWLNRTADVPTFERIQGDLLVAKGEFISVGGPNITRLHGYKLSLNYGQTGSELPDYGNLRLVRYTKDYDIPKVLQDFHKDFRIHEFKDHYFAVPNWEGERAPKAYEVNVMGMETAIFANTSEVTLLHPNHKTKRVQLVAGECAVFTDQRGGDREMFD
jgi:hypothetical protein